MQAALIVFAILLIIYIILACLGACRMASDADDWMEEMLKRKDEE